MSAAGAASSSISPMEMRMNNSSASDRTDDTAGSTAREREELPISHYRFVPIEEAVVPPGGFIKHLKDKWWAVHPENGVAYFVGANGKYFSPQCNSSEATMRWLKENSSWAEIRFIPSVFHRIDPRDYC